MKKHILKVFLNGIFNENPLLGFVLGLCPTLAVSTNLQNAVGMGIAVIFVLLLSNFIVSLLRNFIPEQLRIPCFIVVIASFVTLVEMFMSGFLPNLSRALGIFIPLIVVNCIILGRAEVFASCNKPFISIIDGLGIGMGFLLAISVIAFIRELLGAGTILGFPVALEFKPIMCFTLAPGAFLVMGILLAIYNFFKEKYKK